MDLFDTQLTDPQLLALVAICGVLALCVWDGATAAARWRIANRITVPAIVGAAVVSPLIWDAWASHLAAGLAGFVLLAGVSLAWPAIMGMGPAKLVAAVGLVLGPAVAVVVALAALMTGVDAYAAERAGGPPRVVGVAPHLLSATTVVVLAAALA